VSEPKLLYPKPELPDDTPISDVELPAHIRSVLEAAGLETVGEVREISDETLLSFQDLGKASLAFEDDPVCRSVICSLLYRHLLTGIL
jgi:DNA-directed RNA polymerase alpha subunit